MVAIIRFATVVPNAPGNLGVVNVACVKALQLFDFPVNNGKTFSLILFGAWTLPLLLGGAIATALTGVNIGELRDRAKAGIRAGPAGERHGSVSGGTRGIYRRSLPVSGVSAVSLVSLVPHIGQALRGCPPGRV